MAFKQFAIAALSLAVLVSSQPLESEQDQYENRRNETHAVRLPSEATDPKLQVDTLRPEKGTNVDAGSTDGGRTKRGFSRWTGRQAQLAGYESFTKWKPPVYQLSRPYYIPIYGSPGRIPIYFPPQQLHLNPGVPMDNPMPYHGPSYLPPKEYLPSSTSTTEKTDMGIGDRFDGDDDDDDRPIWGVSMPTTSTERQSSSSIVPTRPPRPPSMPDFPPLVHDVNGGTNFLSVGETRKVTTVDSPRVTTPRPGPSNCAWAIVSCCSAASNVVPDSCFEQRGCPGPFWGSSPCDSDYARAAVQSALNYFN